MLSMIRFQHKVTSKLIQFQNLISNSISIIIFYNNFGLLITLHSSWYYWIGMDKLQPGYNLFMLFSFAIKSNEILDLSSFYTSRISTSMQSAQVIIRKRSPICNRFQKTKLDSIRAFFKGMKSSFDLSHYASNVNVIQVP